MSKGSRQRPTDYKKYSENWDKIFKTIGDHDNEKMRISELPESTEISLRKEEVSE